VRGDVDVGPADARDLQVISQKPKFIEMTNEYDLTDEHGASLGTIRQRVSRRRESSSAW
jgi:hypothetical protein